MSDDGAAAAGVVVVVESGNPVCNSTSSTTKQNDDNDDDLLSVSSRYKDPSNNDLNLWQGASLITADCLGTGVLALPADIQVLGTVFGLVFLILLLPINLYAGTILCRSAAHVEQEQQDENHELLQQQEQNNNEVTDDGIELQSNTNKQKQIMEGDGIVRVRGRQESKKKYASVAATDGTTVAPPVSSVHVKEPQDTTEPHNHHHQHHDTATYDFIGMTNALYHKPRASHMVLAVYYTNLFLVLGNYILVMSHAVQAFVGNDEICLPLAGLVACTLMFAICQLRTMAHLGRSASIISLLALAIVVAQCLVALNKNEEFKQKQQQQELQSEEVTLLRQFSALASIGFAVGSQKLLLNIRHEFQDRSQAPKSLGISLTVFGSVYVSICLLAGPNPPSFLLDAIENGWNRRVAGLLLWIHVAVSYAINSQAICSSMDRLFFHGVEKFKLAERDRVRWMLLTLLLATCSYVVANAVPFFVDLVALTGAISSVPLTLMLPAIFYRHVMGVSVWKPTRDSLVSYALLLFSIIYTILGLCGALGSIELDWANQGAPFACQ